jgi:hypothetical protein
MQLLLKFDIKANKEDISADFWNAHNGSWKNTKKPTNTEFKNSIKNEIDSWLEDLEIDFKMQELPAFITQTEAFNAVVEGMKILDWDKNHGTV